MHNLLQTSIDHVVLGAYSLDGGVNFIKGHLGVLPEAGGQHERMGTHNKLLNLGHSQYLEVIAIDPSLPKPTGPRWFGLDELQPNSNPKLITWVAQTNDIKAAVKNSPFEYGMIETLQRGNYQWQITIPANGGMPLQGLAPTLIQWQGELHPTQTLTAPQVSLSGIEAYHPQATVLNEFLKSVGFNGVFKAIPLQKGSRPFLKVIFKCVHGMAVLES